MLRTFLSARTASRRKHLIIYHVVAKNTFANSLIVIDEAHNMSRSLASSAMNGASANGVTHRLYEMIRSAPGAKVILLTATPIINHALEIAFLVNMVAGPTCVQTIKFANAIVDDKQLSRIRTALMEHELVDTFDLSATSANIRLVPKGFQFDKRSNLIALNDNRHIGQIDQVVLDLKQHIDSAVAWTRKYDTLPTDRNEFEALFVREDGRLKNRNMLARRMMGFISVFLRSDDKDSAGEVANADRSFPTVTCNQTDFVSMGQTQLQEYLVARTHEHKLELKAKGSEGDDVPSVFKYYSRVVCNFVFPHGRAGRRAFRFEDHKMTHDKYDRLTRDALDAARGDQRFWTDDTELARSAPKFVAILARVCKPDSGKCLVYSTFRTWEGIGLFAETLMQRGWRRLAVGKNGEFRLDAISPEADGPLFIEPLPSTKEGQSLIAAFNGSISSGSRQDIARITGSTQAPVNSAGDLVKCILLSKSGAEGLDLACVRQVHIMEPHWNEIALDQVKGRAVRMNSHARLPVEERTVAIFTYVSTFGRDVVDRAMGNKDDRAGALAGASPKIDLDSVIRSDRGQTSDEVVRQIAMAKSCVSQQLTSIMQSAAVDCSAHSVPSLRACYSPGPKARMPSPANALSDRDDALSDGRRHACPRRHRCTARHHHL